MSSLLEGAEDLDSSSKVISIFLPFRQALKIVREKVDHREWCTQYIWLAG